MKQILFLVIVIIFLVSCGTASKIDHTTALQYTPTDTLITQSLFNDKSATISEENIQKILDGTYTLPQQLRVAIVKLEDAQQRRFYWSDEEYLKNQQSYLNLFSEKFKQSVRVKQLSIMPDLLISKNPSFTSIREAAVRMQADVVVVYSITGDIYSKYKLFNKPDIKAFATTQLILLDVRTGLIPFSTIVTKDYLSQKTKVDLEFNESRTRVQHEAVLLTINDIGNQITEFLSKK